MIWATMRSDVIGDFHEPYGAILVGGIWYAIQSTCAVTIAASSADRFFLRQSPCQIPCSGFPAETGYPDREVVYNAGGTMAETGPSPRSTSPTETSPP